MAVLEVENVSQTFGTGRSGRVRSQPTIVTVEARRELAALVGPSGSGKSTLLLASHDPGRRPPADHDRGTDICTTGHWNGYRAFRRQTHRLHLPAAQPDPVPGRRGERRLGAAA